MATAKISLIGLYNYDNNLFDNITMPTVTMDDGSTVTADKDTVINTILLNYGEMETLYSNPEFFKYAVGVLSSKWSLTFSRWIRAFNLTYNPIYNYDRFEKYTDRRTIGRNLTDNGTGKTTMGTTGKITDDGSGSDNSENGNTSTQSVTPYESDTLHTNVQTVDSGHDNHTTTNKNTRDTSGNQTEDSTTSLTENESTDDDLEHDAHLYGNIGVTTSQQMLESELKIAEWNLYDNIALCFVRELAIAIY